MWYYNTSNSGLAQSVLLLLAKGSLSLRTPFSKRKKKTQNTKNKNAVDEKSLLLCLFSGYTLRKPEIAPLLIQAAHSQIFSLGEHSLLT